MAQDFQIRINRKNFKIDRSKFGSKFAYFFTTIKKKQKSWTIDVKETELNKSILNVFKSLRKYAEEENKTLSIFDKVNMFDLYRAVDWKNLWNSRIHRYAIKMMKKRITQQNVEKTLKFAWTYRIEEVIDACKEFQSNSSKSHPERSQTTPKKIHDKKDSVSKFSFLQNKNPNDWTIDEVYDFISNIKGCEKYAKDFKFKEVDGQALMLLEEEDIKKICHEKAGPIAKIINEIRKVKAFFKID